MDLGQVKFRLEEEARFRALSHEEREHLEFRCSLLHALIMRQVDGFSMNLARLHEYIVSAPSWSKACFATQRDFIRYQSILCKMEYAHSVMKSPEDCRSILSPKDMAAACGKRLDKLVRIRDVYRQMVEQDQEVLDSTNDPQAVASAALRWMHWQYVQLDVVNWNRKLKLAPKEEQTLQAYHEIYKERKRLLPKPHRHMVNIARKLGESLVRIFEASAELSTKWQPVVIELLDILSVLRNAAWGRKKDIAKTRRDLERVRSSLKW